MTDLTYAIEEYLEQHTTPMDEVLEITAWKSLTIVGNGWGPMTDPRQ